MTDWISVDDRLQEEGQALEFKNIEEFNKWASNLEKPCIIKDDIKINAYQPERSKREDSLVEIRCSEHCGNSRV